MYRVALALGSVPERDEDAPLRRLAVMYAEAIDDPTEVDALYRYGPKLQAALSELGLSPRARAALKDTVTPAATSRLAAVRGA